jgi:hypothetical protein
VIPDLHLDIARRKLPFLTILNALALLLLTGIVVVNKKLLF